MSKRLQVLLDEEEFDEIRRAARRERLTVAEWVRQSLRAARAEGADTAPEFKLAAVREAARHSYPIGDVEQVLGEIATGYLEPEE